MVEKMHTAVISIGSNIGDKLLNCTRAIERLSSFDDIVLDSKSSFYFTEPVDYTDQDWFINAALKIRTPISPHALLKRLQEMQYHAGRSGDPIRFGPRILDLDLIFYNDLILKTEALELPHPRMHKRRFVLQPICDIDSSIIHPVFEKSVSDLLSGLDQKIQKVIRCS